MFNKKQKFSIKKFTVGVVSVCLGFSFVDANVNVVEAKEVVSINQQSDVASLEYNYLSYEELTEEQKMAVIKGTPENLAQSDKVYYFVYKSYEQKNILPNTGINDDLGYLLSGLGLLVLAVGVSRNKKKAMTSLLVLSLVGTSVAYPIETLAANGILSQYNKTLEIKDGNLANAMIDIPGYQYVGYFLGSKGKLTPLEENVYLDNYINIVEEKNNISGVINKIEKLPENTTKVDSTEEDKETVQVPENAPTIELPEKEIGKSSENPPVLELPNGEIEKNPEDMEKTKEIGKVPDNAPEVELQATGEVKVQVPNTAPKVDLPESEIGKVPDNAPKVELPTTGEVKVQVPNTAPKVELPEKEIGKVPDNAPKVELPTTGEVKVQVPNTTPTVDLPVAEITTEEVSHTETTPQSSETIEIGTMYVGDSREEQGQPKIERVVERITKVDGVEAKREEVSRTVTQEMVNDKTYVGTKPIEEIPKDNSTYYTDENGKTMKVIWVKGINPPKPLSEFTKETVDSYVDYLAKFELGNGWYDSNKRLENADGLNDATQCFSAVATNMLYWWMEQNKEEINKYINYLEENNKFENVEKDTVKDLRYLFNSQGIQQNSAMYNMFVNYFKDRFNGYQTDLLLDFFINGYKPNSTGAANDDEWVDDFTKDTRAGFFHDVFGTKKLSQRMYSGNITTFANTIKNAINENKIIGLEHTTATRYANHIITVWGAEFDENDNIKAIYITDSDDKEQYQKTGMKRWLVKDVGGVIKVSSSINPNIGAKLEYIHTLSLGKEKWSEYLKSINK